MELLRCKKHNSWSMAILAWIVILSSITVLPFVELETTSSSTESTTPTKIPTWADCLEGGDGTLEYCGSCTFANDSFCAYTPRIESGDVEFVFKTQAKQGPKDGPIRDSNYLLLTGQSGIAKLSSAILHNNAENGSWIFNFDFYTNQITLNNYREVERSLSSELFLYLELLDSGRSLLIWQSSVHRFAVAASYMQNDWNRGSVTLGRFKERIRLHFEAHFSVPADQQVCNQSDAYYALGWPVINAHYLSKPYRPRDSCSEGYFHCSNRQCISSDYVCNIDDDCGDRSDELACEQYRMMDFERGWQPGWSSDSWTIEPSYTHQNLHNGPIHDHTNGFQPGHYLITRQNGSVFRMPLIVAQHISFCAITFYSQGQGKLIAQLWDQAADETFELGRVNTGNINWERFYDTIYADRLHSLGITADRVYWVQIIALFGSSDAKPAPYFALDDVSFSKECNLVPLRNLPIEPSSAPTETAPVTDPPHSTVPPEFEAHCPSSSSSSSFHNSCTSPNGIRLCLRAEQLCDFVVDCADGSDEAECGNCNFKSGTLCGWTSVNHNHSLVRWTVIKTAADDGYATVREPPIRCNFDPQSIGNTILLSPRIHSATGPNCKLGFWYQSKSGATFSVGHLRANSSLPSRTLMNMTTRSDSYQQWNRYSFIIGELEPGFQLELVAHTRYWGSSFVDVAIANVQLLDCKP